MAGDSPRAASLQITPERRRPAAALDEDGQRLEQRRRRTLHRAGRHEAGKHQRAVHLSNLTFGGCNRSRLFICAPHTLFAIYANERGAERPDPPQIFSHFASM